MSNRRRLREELGFENWRVRALTSGLQLLAASGCGESSTEVDGVWVDVIVGCRDSGCLQCGSAIGANAPARTLASEEASHDSASTEDHWVPLRSIRSS